jgi:predicted nucleotidyltransferase
MRTLDQITLAPTDRVAIESAAKCLREWLPVERLVLFGSKARGSDSADSDIDLLILTRDATDRSLHNRAIDLLYPLELRLNKWFGLLLISSHDWSHGLYQAMPIHTEIERDGVEV